MNDRSRSGLAFAVTSLALVAIAGTMLFMFVREARAPVDAGGSTRTDANAALVRKLYAAANNALAAGDEEGLRSLLAADFVDHASPPGVAPTADGFAAYLGSLRAAYPGLWLTVADLLAQGDRVVARVQVDGMQGQFLGVPLQGTGLWSDVDVFRVDSGRVVEHWGESLGIAPPVLLGTATLSLDAITRRSLSVERHSFAVDAHESLAGGPSLIVVDRGALTVEVTPAAAEPARLERVDRPGGGATSTALETGSATSVGPGQVLVLPQGRAVRLRNDGGEQAVAVVVSLTVPTPAEHMWVAEPVEPPVVERVLLAGGLAANLASRAPVVTIGRVTLGPGAGLLDHPAAGTELLAVETGIVGVAVADGTSWRLRTRDVMNGRIDSALLSAGDGVLVESGADVSYRSASDVPSVVLFVTISPGDANPPSTPPPSDPA